jgi:hypothetical protein
VNRTLLATLLAGTTLSGGAAQAQSQTAPPARTMPSYDDGEARDPQGYYDREDSSDARRDDPRAAQSDYRQAPSPSGPDDAAHRADRARTAELNQNHYRRPDSNDGYAEQQAEYREQLAQHEQDVRTYQYSRSRYAARIAEWRARADACEAGNIDACEGPDR